MQAHDVSLAGTSMGAKCSPAEEKTEGPCTVLTYLGVELDINQQYSRLLEDKLTDLRQRIHSMLVCTRVILRGVQEVVGHLISLAG